MVLYLWALWTLLLSPEAPPKLVKVYCFVVSLCSRPWRFNLSSFLSWYGHNHSFLGIDFSSPLPPSCLLGNSTKSHPSSALFAVLGKAACISPSLLQYFMINTYGDSAPWGLGPYFFARRLMKSPLASSSKSFRTLPKMKGMLITFVQKSNLAQWLDVGFGMKGLGLPLCLFIFEKEYLS